MGDSLVLGPNFLLCVGQWVKTYHIMTVLFGAAHQKKFQSEYCTDNTNYFQLLGSDISAIYTLDRVGQSALSVTSGGSLNPMIVVYRIWLNWTCTEIIFRFTLNSGRSKCDFVRKMLFHQFIPFEARVENQPGCHLTIYWLGSR